MEKSLKIMAVASEGGHWVQLLRIQSAFEHAEIIYVSTHKSFKSNGGHEKYYSVTDANRWNKLRLLKMASEVRKIVNKEKPDVIISTGAAPGLAAILFGRLSGSRTIWLDSIANVERLSLSGRLIRPFTDLHLTQWPHLAKGKTIFKGTVIS
jgi:UDP-N-acetylglucosamine:LPS N-acetylglucosamine transferase